MNDDLTLDPNALDRLGGLLRQRGALGANEPISSRLISGGRSNLTYEVSSDRDTWVLRRPPLGHVLSTAHDMGREYRVLTALGNPSVNVPVPETVLMCDDMDIIGAPFYVMKRIEGVVLRTADQALALNDSDQIHLSERLIDVLDDLHAIDPVSIGLGDFGKPVGFMPRQVKRWSRQLADSRSRPIHGIEELAADLESSMPIQVDSTIVHGDFRLDNCLVRNGDIEAVLDWEMSTLGDPLSDLGLFAVYYAGLADIPNPIVQSPGGLGSYPSLDVLLDRYALRSGRDLSELDWYIAFAWFKFAVILEGIHYRSTLGATVGEGFDGVSELVQPSVDRGRAALAIRTRRP